MEYREKMGLLQKTQQDVNKKTDRQQNNLRDRWKRRGEIHRQMATAVLAPACVCKRKRKMRQMEVGGD